MLSIEQLHLQKEGNVKGLGLHLRSVSYNPDTPLT